MTLAARIGITPLPCPFCGADAEIDQRLGARWGIRCPNTACGVMPVTSGFKNAAAAVRAWNERKGKAG